MIDYITPGLVIGAARLAAHPALTIMGRRIVRGEDEWGDVCARATPPERPALLARLHPYLLFASAAGRQNWRAWRAAGSPVPTEDALPMVVGDASAFRIILPALACVPPAVRWHLVTFVGVEACGFDSVAWCGAPFTARPIVVRLSPRADVRTVRHEFAHSWHKTPAMPPPCPSALEWAARRHRRPADRRKLVAPA